MEITPTLLKELFIRYNEEYFDGCLPADVKFSTYDGRSSFGMYVRKGTARNISKPEIRLAWNIMWTDDNIKSVMLHEMCHHYVIAKNGGKDGHNVEFFRIAKKISKLSNINVMYPPETVVFSDGRVVREGRLGHFMREVALAVASVF